MSERDFWRAGATELGALYASGETTPEDHLDRLLARIDALNPELNALVTLDPQAREQAAESSVRWAQGRSRSTLDGVPIAIKDNILVAGLRTTWGSRVLRDWVPHEDERPVARLRDAGAVILGKTNCPEFTLEGYTHNELFGTTRNPWDPALTPGGSSGGSVSGVAAGLFPLTLCTDGGGSIRRPASHTGLVGLKPSIGAIARYPSLPQILLDFEVIGPVARTVADVALLFNALAGPDRRDRLSLAPRTGQVELVTPPALKILYVPTLDDSPLDPDIRASVEAAVDCLTALGHEVSVGDLPLDIDAVTRFWPVMGQVGMADLFERYPQAESLAAERFGGMARQGREVPAARYLQGIGAIRDLRQQAAAIFDTIDLILTPTAAALPWPAEQGFPDRIAGQEVGPRGHAVYTGWVNACGHPAISVPCDPSPGGLPIGFQLVGDYGADALLLQVAAQYEALRPFSGRWPALAEGRAAGHHGNAADEVNR